jgi:hypothetical protein
MRTYNHEICFTAFPLLIFAAVCRDPKNIYTGDRGLKVTDFSRLWSLPFVGVMRINHLLESPALALGALGAALKSLWGFVERASHAIA